MARVVVEYFPMPRPVVSVVMSVFNGERFLARAVESILDQSFRDFEFIIIDDGSPTGLRRSLHTIRRSTHASSFTTNRTRV